MRIQATLKTLAVLTIIGSTLVARGNVEPQSGFRCIFTEPFVTVQVDSAGLQVVEIEPSTSDESVVTTRYEIGSNHVFTNGSGTPIARIITYGPDRYLRIDFTQRGSDGMSELTYEYLGQLHYPRGAGAGGFNEWGGCNLKN